MVKRDVILTRLDKLKEYISYLNIVKKYRKEKYISEPFIYGSSERFLHLSIECVLDISNHIISDMNYRKPESNRDIFNVLYENNIINENLKTNLCNMAGFRNILVHDVILNNLCDIEKFIEIVCEYI